MSSVLQKSNVYGSWLNDKEGDVHLYVDPQVGAVLGQNKKSDTQGSHLAVSVKHDVVTYQYHQDGEVKLVEIDKDEFAKAVVLFLNGLKALVK